MITGIDAFLYSTLRHHDYSRHNLLTQLKYFIKKYPKFLLSYSAFVLLDIFQNPSMYLSRMRNKSIPISIHVITGVTLEPVTMRRRQITDSLCLNKNLAKPSNMSHCPLNLPYGTIEFLHNFYRRVVSFEIHVVSKFQF